MIARTLICCGLFLSLPLCAQLDQFSSPSGFGNTYIPRTKSELKEVKGSPYLNEEFLPSVIQLKDGKLYEDVPLRYNVMSDEIEFLRSDGEVRAMNSRDMTQWAVIGQDTLVTRLLVRKEKQNFAHFILLEAGQLQLLVKKAKSFREATNPEGYSEGTDPAYVDKADSYYFGFSEDNTAMPVPRKKDLAAMFPEHGKALSELLKREKLSLKKEEDLRKLVHSYNKL